MVRLKKSRGSFSVAAVGALLMGVFGFGLLMMQLWNTSGVLNQEIAISSSDTSLVSLAASLSSRDDPEWESSLSSEWKPLDCRAYMREVYAGTGASDPNNGQLYAKRTVTSKPFWINVHNSKFDAPRFVVWDKGYYYEKGLTSIFEQILSKADPNARVIDVGGNIGWFTFLSASMGHHVDVFEPNPVNIIRQCQSKWLNEWPTATEKEINSRQTKRSTINLRKYGVAEKPSVMSMHYKNPGMGTFLNSRDILPRQHQTLDAIPLISLDQMATELNWFISKPKFAILKIDVEGFEPPVVAGAKKFLASGMVENILMEMTGREDNADTIQMVRNILDAGYELHKFGKSKGPTKTPPKELPFHSKEEFPKALVDMYIPTSHKQCNLWWKRKGQA